MENQEICKQLVKLTKQNQYLYTRIQVLNQQIDQLMKMKEKYKNKYKGIKEILRECEIERIKQEKEQNSMKNNEKLRQQMIFHELNRNHLKNQQNMMVIQGIICKVYNSIQSIQQRIEGLLENEKFQNNPSLFNRIIDMGQTLNSIAFKIKQNDDSHQMKKKSEKIIPERDIDTKRKNLGRFVESKSHRQFRNNPQASSNDSRNHSNWKMLKQIGKELKEWKFSISDESV